MLTGGYVLLRKSFVYLRLLHFTIGSGSRNIQNFIVVNHVDDVSSSSRWSLFAVYRFSTNCNLMRLVLGPILFRLLLLQNMNKKTGTEDDD